VGACGLDATQGRDHWWTLVNMVMNIPDSLKDGNLTSWQASQEGLCHRDN
jgi:hypothetical protein